MNAPYSTPEIKQRAAPNPWIRSGPFHLHRVAVRRRGKFSSPAFFSAFFSTGLPAAGRMVLTVAQRLIAHSAQPVRRCVAALAGVVHSAGQQAVIPGAQALAARAAQLMRAAHALAGVVRSAGQQAVVARAQRLAARRAQPVR